MVLLCGIFFWRSVFADFCVSAHADDDLSAASARRTGKRACLAKPSFTSKATPASMACGCPTRPARSEARLNSRFANVKSLRQGRRLRPRPGHPSACMTGPMVALVRWFLSGPMVASGLAYISRKFLCDCLLKPLLIATGPVSASRRSRAAQGFKRSAVRSGATLARRKFRPRPEWHGWGGNSTRCGSPFLWVLSFGEAKAKYLASGARPAKLNAVALDENRVAIAKSKQALHPLTGMMICMPLPRGGRERDLCLAKDPFHP